MPRGGQRRDNEPAVYSVVSDNPDDETEEYPRGLKGLDEAIGRAMWLSVAGTPRSVKIGGRTIGRYKKGRRA